MIQVRRGFIRKVLSPVIGYGADYELLHFVYDLSMWTTIGTKKNIAHQFGTPLRFGAQWHGGLRSSLKTKKTVVPEMAAET